MTTTTRTLVNPFLNPFWWVPTAAKPAPAASSSQKVSVDRVKNSDRGLTVTQTPTSVTVKGTARGVETRSPWNPDETSDFLKTEQFGGELSLGFDLDTMPAFDTSRGYTEKNRWYFAHTAAVTTSAGMSAEAVVRALAARIKHPDYRPVVTVAADGAATLRFERR